MKNAPARTEASSRAAVGVMVSRGTPALTENLRAASGDADTRGRPFIAFLRRRRGAPRPQPEREWAAHEHLQARERHLKAVAWYVRRRDNLVVHHA
jgi:hypothetical protein